jgi:hypothetical protein
VADTVPSAEGLLGEIIFLGGYKMNYVSEERNRLFPSNENIPCCDPMHKPPAQPVVETMGETSAIAEQILRQVRRINEFLFAEGPSLVEEANQTKCFRDELVNTRNVLGTASEELERISNRLFST